MRRFLALIFVLLSGKFLLATKEGNEWSYITNCDPLDRLDCALDLEQKELTRLDNILDEDYQAEINLASIGELQFYNNQKLDE